MSAACCCIAERLEPPNELLHTKLHGVIGAVEQLQQAGQYHGDLQRLLDLVDEAGHDRPVSIYCMTWSLTSFSVYV